jgi:hypothetical protein
LYIQVSEQRSIGSLSGKLSLSLSLDDCQIALCFCLRFFLGLLCDPLAVSSAITAILIISEGRYQAFQRFSSSKLVLKTVASCFSALHYYENGSAVPSMYEVPKRHFCTYLSSLFLLLIKKLFRIQSVQDENIGLCTRLTAATFLQTKINENRN